MKRIILGILFLAVFVATAMTLQAEDKVAEESLEVKSDAKSCCPLNNK